MDIPVKGVVSIAEMRGDTDDETTRLRAMSKRAQQFLEEFSWCGRIRALYFGAGVGDVFAVFFASIEPAKPNVDEFLWIVVGDIPPAYLVIDDCHTPREAMDGYIEEMRRWVAAAKHGETSDDIIPVNAPSTPEFAELLEKRLDALQTEIMPAWFAE